MDDERVPKLTEAGQARSVKALPLSMEDGYLLSRIDGVLSVHELGALLGLADTVLRGSLAKLEGLGLVVLVEPPPRRVSSPRPGRSSPRAPGPATPPPAAPPPRLPTDLDEDSTVELSPEHRKRVKETHARLGAMNHYELLGVARDADRKAIKNAYYELAAVFHPDRYFRKTLGPYKALMEACFGRMTQAHDVLTSKKRAEYDAYLDGLGVTARAEAAAREAAAVSSQLDAVTRAASAAEAAADVQRIEDLLRQALEGFHGAPPEAAGQGSSTPPPVGSSPPVAPRGAQPVEKVTAATKPAGTGASTPAASAASAASAAGDALAAQRQALARRLLGGRAPPTRGSSASQPRVAQPTAPRLSPEEAMRALKQRYTERVEAARTQKAQEYSSSAREAIAANDPVGAANAYRIALTLCPEDDSIKAAFEGAQKLADGILGDMYVRQAQYEEESFNYAAAAQSWGKAARARPADAHARARAARTLLESGGDAAEALAFAREAVDLEPNHGEHRLLLGQLLLTAARPLEAQIEVDAAARLLPGDPRVETLQKKLRKTP